MKKDEKNWIYLFIYFYTKEVKAKGDLTRVLQYLKYNYSGDAGTPFTRRQSDRKGAMGANGFRRKSTQTRKNIVPFEKNIYIFK